MKLTNKIALISGLGCLALVGSGFAAWTYANGASVDQAAATNSVNTKAVANGSITIDSASLKFDLDEKTSLETGSLKMGAITWDASTSLSFHYAPSVKTSEKVTYSVVASVPGAGAAGTLSYYVDFGGAANQTLAFDNGGSGYDMATSVSIDTSKLTLAPIQDATDSTKNHMPQTSAAWDTMDAAFKVSTNVVSFKITATIVD